jgi:hypothetical protein
MYLTNIYSMDLDLIVFLQFHVCSVTDFREFSEVIPPVLGACSVNLREVNSRSLIK